MADTYPITESIKREILTSSTFFVRMLLIICGQMQVLKQTVYTKPKNCSIGFILNYVFRISTAFYAYAPMTLKLYQILYLCQLFLTLATYALGFLLFPLRILDIP